VTPRLVVHEPKVSVSSQPQANVQREPGTVQEAAGEIASAREEISLNLDEVDLDALGEEPTPEEVQAWAIAYIDKAALEASLDDPKPAPAHLSQRSPHGP
jgi:hypothetical protein